MSDNEKAATAPEAPKPEVKEPVQPQSPPRRGETFKGAGVQKTKGVS